MQSLQTSPRYRRLVLTGFMGAGKSTVGRLLAPMLDWRFVDADTLLSERMGATIAELFVLHGEQNFREHEALLVGELLAAEEHVIALGGGAVEHAGTRAALAASAHTLVVYLAAPLAVSLARCAAEPGSAARPVLADREALERRFLTRLPFYEAAQLTVPTEAETPASVARAIVAAMRLQRSLRA